MSDQKKPFYKSFTFLGLIGIAASWIIIYSVWVNYPERLMSDDRYDSRNLPENIWKGVPYQIPTEEEIEGRSYYAALGEKYAAHGDMYGSLNTLFSGLAFATLIISLFLQMLELRETRKEMAKQSKALADQEKQFKKQTDILNEQVQIAKTQKIINENQQKIINEQYKESQKIDFRNHFFKLIDQKNIMMDSLTMPSDEGVIIYGHKVFYEYYLEFRKFRSKFDPTKHNYKFMKLQWNNFTKKKYGSYNYQLHSYFKIYRVIFNAIGTSKSISDTEKKYYANIFRMLLTTEEQLVLMWASTFNSKLKYCCNKFGLLDGIYNLNLEKIGTYFFKVEAFGNNTEWDKVFEVYEKEKAAKDSAQSTTIVQPQSNEP